MKPVTKRKATGVLAQLLAENRETELMRTRKRMMLAVKIADALRNAGYTQKDFATKMGKSETVVSEWLSGDRNFTIDTLSDIEEVLGVRLLDTTVMTVITADAEISQKSHIQNNKSEAVNSNCKWSFEVSDTEYEDNLRCA